MRHLLIEQHHSTHRHVQSIYTDLQKALDFVKKLDEFILYGLVISVILYILAVCLALCISQKCTVRHIKSQNKARDRKVNFIAMRNLKQSAPLLPTAPQTPTYNLVFQNPTDGTERTVATRGSR